MGGVRVALALVALLLVPARARAEDDDDGEPERVEGLTIDTITVECSPSEDEAALMALSGLAAGRAYRAEDVRRAVKVLFELGRFENVVVRAGRTGNVVALELLLFPKQRIRVITVENSGVVAQATIQAALKLQAGDELDVTQFPERRKTLATALERMGYRSAAIGLAARRLDPDGGSELVVRVDEGHATHLRRVRIRGAPRRRLRDLASYLEVAPGDVLDLDKVDRSLARLIEVYKADGHLDVSIAPPEIRDLHVPEAEHPMADLILDISAGPEVRVRFKGHRSVPLHELEAAAAIMTEIGTGPSALAEVRERILAAYELRGFWRAKVEPAVRETPDGARKEILYSIDEGERGRVKQIEFPGNTAIEAPLLRDKLLFAVEQTVGDALDRPSADPREVSGIVGPMGEHAETERPEPYADLPEAGTLYLDRAYRGATDALADLYRARGYQNVDVRPPEVTASPDGRDLSVVFPVSEGVQWKIGALSMSGNEVVEAGELLTLAEIEPGEPLSFYKVEDARRVIQSHYHDLGYLYARVEEDLREVTPRGALSGGGYVRTSTSRPLDVATICARADAAGAKSCDVELVFRIREGEQVKTRRVVVRGTETTRESLVRGELSVTEGGILRESDMRESQRNLVKLGVFTRVSVRPLDEEKEAPEKDVLVEVKEKKHSSFEIGAGASTEEGVRVFAGYGHDDVFGSALRFQSNAKVNVQPFLGLYSDSVRAAIADAYAKRPIEFEVGVGVSYPRIVGLPRGFGAGLDITVVRDNEPTFSEDTRTVTLAGSYKGFEPRILGRPRPLYVSLRGSFEWSDVTCTSTQSAELVERCLKDSPGAREGKTTVYLGLKPGVSWDFRDDTLNPRKGFLAEVRPELYKGLNADSTDHMNLRLMLNLYLPVPLSEGAALAISGLFWRIFPFGEQKVPINRLYRAGGRSTLRGFQEQTLFPADTPGNPTGISPGGTVFAAVKTELRIPLTENLGWTLFYDVGDLFDDPAAFVIDDRIRQGLGTGIRYATPIGPLMLEVAHPLVTRFDVEKVPLTVHFAAVGTF